MKAAAKQAGGRGSFALAVEVELSECEFCGRKFSTDVLERHSNVCREHARRQANKKPDQSKTDALLKRMHFKAPLPGHNRVQQHQATETAPAV